MSKITFAEEGWDDYIYWQIEDRKTLRRINDLLKSIERDGAMKGIGKPEKLKHKEKEYSRRINDIDRLVYEVVSNQIIVKSCRGHYED